MRGFPKHLNTKQDVENVKDLFPKETADYLQRLAEGRFIWVDAGLVADQEVVKESADLRVIPVMDEAGKPVLDSKGNPATRKLERVEDPNAHLFKLELAAEELTAAKEAAASVEAAVNP
jgi:hypothetical protein